ncbi:MAG TPA: hypothetical protein VNU71_15895, partial [Burkholderiaceae bacterium]|nr:hypothetical protein [Burkholderiaceae bacterium]
SQSFKPATRHLGAERVVGVVIALARVVASAFSSSRSVKAAPSLEQEANELRAYAQQFMKSDPGFADDLFAAADRHEEAAFVSTAR